jgi:predicted transcriptional regulator of viral defense system
MSDAWRDQFVRDSEIRQRGARARLAREVRAGRLVRTGRGVYTLPAGPSLRPHEIAERRYRNLVRSVQLTSPEPPIFSHHSAAVLWRLPAIEQWPSRVHVAAGPSTGGRSTAFITRHGVDGGEPALIDGLMATSLARTVLDVARSSTFREGVAMADAALHGVTDGGGRVL